MGEQIDQEVHVVKEENGSLTPSSRRGLLAMILDILQTGPSYAANEAPD
jgi:hypothetical protein